MKNPDRGARDEKSERRQDAAAIVAGEARAAGLDVRRDRQGRFRIVGSVAELGRIRWRTPAIATERLEILVGPAVRRPSGGDPRGNKATARSSDVRAEDATAEPANPYVPGAKARALLRGRRIADADLKAAGGTFGLHEVMDLLRISRQAIDKKVKLDALLAVPGPGNERRYPSCQFHRGGIVPGLRAVLQALPSRDPWFRLNFLVNPAPSLANRRPCDVLREGDPGTVVAAAERVADMGA